MAHNKGLTVNQVNDLRGRMAQAGATVKVAKNRLAKLALDGTARSRDQGPVHRVRPWWLTPPIPVAAPKVASDFAKANEKFVVLGGALGKTTLDAAAVKALADLPSLDQLRAKLVGMLQTPATRIAGVLQAPAASWRGCSTPMPPKTRPPDGSPLNSLVQTDRKRENEMADLAKSLTSCRA